MKEPFELEWLGGVAEKSFRRLRPEIDDLPWGTLHAERYPPLLVERARMTWTEGAHSEYRAAFAFTQVLRELLQAKAPVDLVGMAGGFVGDEVLHVEMASRVAMELGGGAPLYIDYGALETRFAPELSALQRASEIVVRCSCVSETLSRALVRGALRVVEHPLVRGVQQIIAHDESKHSRLGWLYLEWVSERLDDAERERLARVALSALRKHEPFWKNPRSEVHEGRTTEGYELSHIHELGWLESEQYVACARAAVGNDVLAPLARFGIEPAEADIEALLAGS